MRISFIAPFGIRPKGTVIARMLPIAAELQKIGHRVTIVAPPYTNPEDSGKTERVMGVELRNVRLGPRSRSLAALVLGRRLYRAAMDGEPDVIHLFKPKGYGGVAAFAHILLRRLGRRLPPLFVDVDDWEGAGGMNEQLPYGRAERTVFGLQEEWLQRRANGVTAASRTLEARALEMGIAPERVLYLPNSVSAPVTGDGGRVRERLGIAADAPVLLIYTRFFEFEQERLHRILAEIHRQVAGVRFLVVGKGRRGEEGGLVRAAQQLGFAGGLVMAGWVEPGEIPDYLSSGDAALYPFADTLVNRAKCPAKLTELLSSGVPVVADRVGQVAEYIVPGSSGILCDPGDWRRMADEAAQLLLDRERSRELGERGRRRLLEHFRWDVFAARLAAFYGADS